MRRSPDDLVRVAHGAVRHQATDVALGQPQELDVAAHLPTAQRPGRVVAMVMGAGPQGLSAAREGRLGKRCQGDEASQRTDSQGPVLDMTSTSLGPHNSKATYLRQRCKRVKPQSGARHCLFIGADPSYF